MRAAASSLPCFDQVNIRSAYLMMCDCRIIIHTFNALTLFMGRREDILATKSTAAPANVNVNLEDVVCACM